MGACRHRRGKRLRSKQLRAGTREPGVKVSWMVTGIRNDPYSQQHPVTAEDKGLTYQMRQQLGQGPSNR